MSDPTTMRNAVFTLDVSYVAVSFPERISVAEVDQIEAYFGLLLQGMRRRSEAPKPADDPADEANNGPA